MNFLQTFQSAPVLLNDGALAERLRRDPSFQVDPDIAHASAVYSTAGKTLLRRLLRQYLEIGREFDLPLVLSSTTFRASPDRVRQTPFGDASKVNRDCVLFMDETRREYGAYAAKVFIAGIVGCRGDAYKPEESLSPLEAARYHREQVRALAEAGVDALFAYTLPAAAEGIGIARAMAESGLPYAISFILQSSGRLLDGAPFHEVVHRIDRETKPRPLFYMSNCCHSSIFSAGMKRELELTPHLKDRVLAFKANTSSKSPEELDGLEELDTEDPENFAAAMVSIHREFGIKMLGGCCGTDHRHLRCLARKLADSAPSA